MDTDYGQSGSHDVEHSDFQVLLTYENNFRHPIVIVSVPSKLWSIIATDRINHSFLPRVIQERMHLLPNGNVINDGDFWFILELERFKINTGSSNVELEFSFRDVENGGRKAGMKWDYIELKKN